MNMHIDVWNFSIPGPKNNFYWYPLLKYRGEEFPKKLWSKMQFKRTGVPQMEGLTSRTNS